jgi:hypothetical protein
MTKRQHATLLAPLPRFKPTGKAFDPDRFHRNHPHLFHGHAEAAEAELSNFITIGKLSMLASVKHIAVVFGPADVLAIRIASELQQAMRAKA